VISAIHNACIGGALDLITAADIRYCTSDAWFQVKEVDIGKWKYYVTTLETPELAARTENDKQPGVSN
jgi:enoyl-CoA hydratase/carnithine racemase